MSFCFQFSDGRGPQRDLRRLFCSHAWWGFLVASASDGALPAGATFLAILTGGFEGALERRHGRNVVLSSEQPSSDRGQHGGAPRGGLEVDGALDGECREPRLFAHQQVVLGRTTIDVRRNDLMPLTIIDYGC